MRFLYRFGVTLALDAATHDHLPALIQATPAERDIAAEIEPQRLVARLVFVRLRFRCRDIAERGPFHVGLAAGRAILHALVVVAGTPTTVCGV
jgi:hypothetical protein